MSETENKKALLNRREALGVLGVQAIGLGVFALTGCAGSKNATQSGETAPLDPRTRQSQPCQPATNVTRGPYFVDDREDPNIDNDVIDPNIPERSDIRADTEDSAGVQQGLPLSLKLVISSTNAGTCAPVPNAQVHIWHCNALGLYSDVQSGPPAGGPPPGSPPPGGTPGTGPRTPGVSPSPRPPIETPPAAPGETPSTVGQNFLRGYQFTNANGEVNFTTIYPGWYTGRAVHIHVKVRIFDSSGNVTTEATTQLFFDDTVTSTVYRNNAPYNTRASTPDTTNATDGIYASMNPPLLVNLKGSATAGYSGDVAFAINLGSIFGG